MRKLLTASTIAALTLTLTTCGEDKDDEFHGVSRADAKDACRNRIKELLVSPGTADFEGFSETQYTPSSKGVYVEGHVDSENSFGGTIRTTYQCEVWNDGDQMMVKVTKTSESNG